MSLQLTSLTMAEGGSSADSKNNYDEDEDKTVLVIDSNILMKKIPTLRILSKDSRYILFIPWRVTTELDGLKYNQNKNIAKNARKANRFYSSEEFSNSRHLCQNAIDAKEIDDLFPDSNKDDSIIKSAIQLRAKYPTQKIEIYTLDRNLQAKAKIGWPIELVRRSTKINKPFKNFDGEAYRKNHYAKKTKTSAVNDDSMPTTGIAQHSNTSNSRQVEVKENYAIMNISQIREGRSRNNADEYSVENVTKQLAATNISGNFVRGEEESEVRRNRSPPKPLRRPALRRPHQ